jgi:hypothetical protein
MLRVQAVLLLLCTALVAVEAPSGEDGLAALAAARAGISAVEGAGTQRVTRIDDPEAPANVRAVRFAVAADGRYDIVLTDPADPDGERLRFVSDGATAAEISLDMAGEQPVVKLRPAAAQDAVQRLLACLRLDLAELRRSYAVELRAAEGGQRELRLTPTDPAVLREVVAVAVRLDPAGRPLVVILDEAGGNRRSVVLDRFVDDPALDAARFAVPGHPDR